MTTRCEYLTARCPWGCEAWLHPKAVTGHEHRCRHEPWTNQRRLLTETFLIGDDADAARSICPGQVSMPPVQTGRGAGGLTARAGDFNRQRGGGRVILRSPLENVSARRWFTVLRAADAAGWATRSAFDTRGFEHLEQQLGSTVDMITCRTCGDEITRTGYASHRRGNSACRFIGAVHEVHTFWDMGYRDPYSVRREGVPLTWKELNALVRWRNRLHIIKFPLWTAVLLSPSNPVEVVSTYT